MNKKKNNSKEEWYFDYHKYPEKYFDEHWIVHCTDIRKNRNYRYSWADNLTRNEIIWLLDLQFKKNPDLALAVFNKIFKPKIEWKSYSQLSSGTKMIYFNESWKDWKLQIIKIVSWWKESSFIKEWNNFYLSVNQNSRELIRNDSLYVFIHKLNTEVNTAIDMENKKIEHEKHAKNQEICRNIELAENSARGQEIQEVENMMDDYLSIV